MDENAPKPALKQALLSPKFLGMLALGLALGAGGAAGFYVLRLKPMRAIADRRFAVQEGLVRLYDLQVAYRAARGTYANDLESLLATAPDGAALREKLRANSDYNTLTVVGGPDRFKLEANVLDDERTRVRLVGPMGPRAPVRPEIQALPEPDQSP